MRGAECPEAAGWLVERLRLTSRPVKRDRLAEELRQRAAEAWGHNWTLSTAARRLREAIKAARRQGWPIVSLGRGFQLARTQADRHKAAERLRDMARDLMAEASHLEAASVPGDQVQRALFTEAGGEPGGRG